MHSKYLLYFFFKYVLLLLFDLICLSFQYEIIDIPTAESLDFSTTPVILKSECDDGQLVPIWDSI